jgi:hypothetical protein
VIEAKTWEMTSCIHKQASQHLHNEETGFKPNEAQSLLTSTTCSGKYFERIFQSCVDSLTNSSAYSFGLPGRFEGTSQSISYDAQRPKRLVQSSMKGRKGHRRNRTRRDLRCRASRSPMMATSLEWISFWCSW